MTEGKSKMVLIATVAAIAAMVAGVGTAGAVDGNMTITSSVSDPDSNLIESQLDHNDWITPAGELMWTSSAHVIYGQSFTHDGANYDVDTLWMVLDNESDGTPNVQGVEFQVNIFSLLGDDHTPDEILLDANGFMPASLASGIQWITFDFDETAQFQDGVLYGFSVDFTSENPNHETNFRRHNLGGQYSGVGDVIYSMDGGATWDDENDSIAFAITGTQVFIPRDANYSYWNVDGDGNWDVNANWDPNTAFPNAPGAKTRFTLANFGGTDTNNKVITIDGNVTVGHMLIEGSFGYTFTGNGTGTLIFDGNGEDATVTIADGTPNIYFDTGGSTNFKIRLDSNLVVDFQGNTSGEGSDFGRTSEDMIDLNGNDLTLRNVDNVRYGGITDSDGNGTVTFEGSGEWTGDGFDNSNWTGETFINEGVVHLWYSRLGATSHAYVADGATIRISGDWSHFHDVTLRGTGDGGRGAIDLTSGDPITWSGTVTLAADSRIDVGGGLLRFSNTIDGSGTLEKTGSAEMVLQGDNTYTGGTIITGGTVIADNSSGSATGTGNVIVTSAGVLTGDGAVAGVIDLTGELRPGDIVSGTSVVARPGSLGGVDANFNTGGLYTFDMNDATGGAGTGWDLLDLSGTLNVLSTDSNFTLDVNTYDAGFVAGDTQNFNPSSSYVWQIIAASTVTGFDANKFVLDVSGFTNPGANASLFAITSDGNGVNLTYTAEQLTAVMNGNWATPATWDGNKVPEDFSTTLFDDYTVTVASTGQVAMKVVIDASDTLVIDPGADLEVGFEMVATGGLLTVNGALTAPTGELKLGSTVTVGGSGSISAKNIVVSASNVITAGTVTATSSFTVTGSSSLNMSGSELVVSSASLAIDTGSTLTVDQLALAVGGALTVDGALVLDGTTLQANGDVTVGGTITANIGNASGGIELAGGLSFTGSSVNLVFNGNPGGDYYGLRWAGNHYVQLTGWLDAGSYTGDGNITATAPGPLDINDINVGFDGNFTYIGFGGWPVPAIPAELASLTFDSPYPGGTDSNYYWNENDHGNSGITDNVYDIQGTDGNVMYGRNTDGSDFGEGIRVLIDPVDATGYTGLQLSFTAANTIGMDSGHNWLEFFIDLDDGNSWVSFSRWDSNDDENALQDPDTGDLLTIEMTEYTINLPASADGSDYVAIQIWHKTRTDSEQIAIDDLSLFGTPPVVIPPITPGDVNGDGNVDTLDITPFVNALLADDEDAFGIAYPDWEYWAGDVNEDGNVDTLDITPFVGLLTGGGSEVPEPATMVLLGLGALGLVVRRRRRSQA